MNLTQPLPQPIQFGKYTLFERIGRGGMADVFKGRIQGPAGFERVFVVKRILPHLSDDPIFIKMFVEEAKLSARLNHPNIVQVFELGSVDSEYFISMEYIDGRDLADTMRALWKTIGPPPADLVAFIGREICRALSYAHGLTDERGRPLGMIHRDVSPSNVMLSYEGAVKLLDFGIAKAMGEAPETTKSGALKGKYAYMAPEQTDGEDLDHRIDIFAAGIVLHEVLAGRRLFKGQNDIQTIERVRRCEVRPPSQVNPNCPPELDAIVLKALSRRREDRFQTAADMADALDDIVHAARFTPQDLSITLRQMFGAEGATTASGADRRATRTTQTPISTSGNRPPSSPSRPSSPVGAAGAGAGSAVNRSSVTASLGPAVEVDAKAIRAIRPRPFWKNPGFWMVGVLCASVAGLAITKGARFTSDTAVSRSAVPVNSPRSPAKATVKRKQVLIQSYPEGAQIYIPGKLESVGVTPKWVTLEMDDDSPGRLMLRKPGYQDKAVAVEQERPPVVTLLALDPAVGETVETPAKKKTEKKARAAAARTTPAPAQEAQAVEPASAP